MGSYSLVVYSFISFFTIDVFCMQSSRIVNTKQGQVEGYLSSSGLYYEFCGIRYGVIKGRYMAPVDPPSFSGIYAADNRVVLCPQFPSTDPLAALSDNCDCLVLNVFVPSFTNDSLPVMVFLHGGDFGVGGSSPYFYGPKFLVSHGVIVVTVNYRLNAFGFLNLGIEEAPGNAGLKDIRAALRWIQRNIESFGGSPDNVTVFGHGSGGVAAIYLTLSNSSKGLFERIISESGSLFTPKSFDSNPLATASQIAKCLGVNSNDATELYDLFENVDINELELAIGSQMNAKSVFLPSVEEFHDDDPFLTDIPYNILCDDTFTPVPAIFGLNAVEGLISTLDYYTITSQVDRLKHEDFTCIDQRSLNGTEKQKQKIRDILKSTYFTNLDDDEAIIGGLINLNSDFCFVGPMSLLVDMYTNNSNCDVYQYIFNYIGDRNLGKILTNTTLDTTTHMDELFYIFGIERMSLPLNEEDARIVTFMTMMWTNFAKHGNPTPDVNNGEWAPYPHNLAISLDPQYVQPLTIERSAFWRSLYLEYGTEVKKSKH